MTVGSDLDAQARRPALQRINANNAAWSAAMRRPPRGRGNVALWPPSVDLMLMGVVTVAVLALIMIAADAWAIVAARGLPRWLIDKFETITDFGKSGWLLWPIGVALAGLGIVSSSRLGWIGERVVLAFAVRLTFLFVAIGLPGLVDTIGKRLIGRARPFVGGSADPFLYHPFSWDPAYASLPSGHATTSFAAALAIGAVWPRSRPVVWTFAVVIAISRVVVSAHHPSDVIAGAIVGVLGAMLVRNWFAARRLAFAVCPDGSVLALPGPSWRRLKEIAATIIGQ
jgi:undecaprenyl-diphosphatase